jgi:hypothetical protein
MVRIGRVLGTHWTARSDRAPKLCGMHIKHFTLVNKKDLTLVKADELNRRCIRALHVMNRGKYNNHDPTITQSESNKTISFISNKKCGIPESPVHS